MASISNRIGGDIDMKIVALAGSFNPLHDGHKALIDKALSLPADMLQIGIMSSGYINKTKGIVPISEFSRTISAVEYATNKHKMTIDFDIMNNIFWDILINKDIAYLVVSDEKDYTEYITHVNGLRKYQGLNEIEIVIVQTIKDANGDKLSSTNIRNGKINEHGCRKVE